MCFDCNAKNPTWASVTYGVFICIDCSAVHRGLGVHVTFVRSTQLDTNWTWLQLRQMQLGGNANALTFFRQHNCTTTDAQQKYTSRAAQLYREKLHQLAMQAMRSHGTKLHLDSASEQTQPEEKKEEDFFTSLSADNSNYSDEKDHFKAQTPELVTADPAMNLMRGQPNVEAALITQPDTAQQELRKPTIGGRKQQTKRSGLGAKKGGLGAQKVKANFDEIEREAAMADQLKVQAAEEAKLMAEKTVEEEQKQIASMRLAYQDLSLQQKKEQEKLKHIDPMKAQQIERLGMGFASRTGVSHSALSDMKTIEQESPNKAVSSSARSVFDRDSDRDGFFDDFHFSSPSLGFGMYKSSPSENKSLEAMFLDGNTSRDRYSSKGWGSFELESRQPSSSSHMSEDRPASRTDAPSSSSTSVGNEAQKKFGSAKAISSEQFFGDSSDNNWERKANLSRFEGSLSISSADYFGTGSSHNSSSGSHLTTPDLEDVKESVRQGVTKVAGKLSSIADGVMSSIQDRYGY